MKKTILVMVCLLIPVSSFAIGQSISDKTEIMGCWERVLYPPEIMAQMSKRGFYHPELQKYQWYCFFDDGVFRVVTANKSRDFTATETVDLFKSAPVSMTWEWIQDSIVKIEHKDDPSMNAYWFIARIDEDTRVFGDNLIQQGSYFMAIPTEDLNSFEVVRVLKKLKDE